VRGGELDLGAEFADVSAGVNYTYSHSVQAGDLQIDAVPVQQAKASLDYHPENHPFGLTATRSLSAMNINQGWGRGMAARSTANIRSWTWRDAGFWIPSATISSASAWKTCFDRQYATALSTAERDSTGASTHTGTSVVRARSRHGTLQILIVRASTKGHHNIPYGEVPP